MPELPEVETVRMQLRRKIVGKKVSEVKIHHPKSVAHDDKFARKLRGKIIADIDRVGKLMIFSFAGEADFYLLAHLKMTGQFFFVDNEGETVGGGHSISGTNHTYPTRHTRVTFNFDDKTTLHFNDMRLFGFLKIVGSVALKLAKEHFGQEPINPNFDVDDFAKKLKRRKTPIKAALLDQTLIAGLGNIYVDEALWRAKIRPTRRADKVTKKEVVALTTAAGDVMNESIAVGGTTFQHFKDTGGDNGNFKDFLKVFGKQGQACERCDTIIKKIRCAGRGTHYCPGCQK